MSTASDNVERMVELVRGGRARPDFVRRAHDFEPADLADVLAALDEDERIAVVQALPAELSSQALAEMPEEAHAEETLAALIRSGPRRSSRSWRTTTRPTSWATSIPQRRSGSSPEVEDRADVEQLLRYDEETAGGLMTTHVVTVPDTATAEEALEAIRRQAEEVEDFYQVFVVDADRKLVGILPFKDLVISQPERPVRDFHGPTPTSAVTPDLDQEEVARVMARYNLPSVAGGGRAAASCSAGSPSTT